MDNDVRSDGSSLPSKAFENAARKFASKLSDDNDFKLPKTGNTIQDIQNLIEESQQKYRNERKFPKAKKWLRKASSTLQHYSSCIDTFAQIDPLHVSLVWGSLKVVMTAAQNHAKTISTLSKALSNIAAVLPRVELAAGLYPTEDMRIAVEELYTNIFEFFSRAYTWYREGMGRHVLHSFTSATQLEYEDLSDEIDRISRNIDKLALLGSQHKIDRQLTYLISKMDSMHAMVINTDQRVTDVQFSRILTFLSKGNLEDPMSCYLFNQSCATHRNQSNAQLLTNGFWNSPKLERWTTTKQSSIMFLQGNAKIKPAIHRFFVRMIDQLRENHVAVLWALPSGRRDQNNAAKACRIGLLKYLTLQALQVYKKLPNESLMSRLCTQFETLSTEHEWIRMLARVLTTMASQCYIVIDSSILVQGYQSGEKGGSWLRLFNNLFLEVANGNAHVQIKVLVFTDKPRLELQSAEPDRITSDLIIPVKERVVPKSMRKKVDRIPRSWKKAVAPRTLRTARQ